MARYILLWFSLLCPLFLSAQVQDDFSDESATSATWFGDWNRFAVNRNGWLQSQAREAAESTLFTPSESSLDATWKFDVRISGTCSAYNRVRFYLTMAGDSLNDDGYFVQVGGGNKNIVLYEVKEGTEKKVIECVERKKILSDESLKLQVKVTRDLEGVFHLYSCIESIDTVWVKEGSYFASYAPSQYVAWNVKNSKQRGYDFYLDNVVVTGMAQYSPLEKEDTVKKHDEIDGNLSFSLSSDSFSPNGDGWQDEVCLSANIDETSYLDDGELSCSVYTAIGVRVRTLCNQQAWSEIDAICWNGMGENGDKMDIGVYVLDLEAKHTDGRIYRKKYAVALLK